MIPDEEDFDEIRRRLRRLEMVVAALVAGSGSELNEEALFLLTRLFRDDLRGSSFKADQDLEFLIRRLLDYREPSRTGIDAEGIRALRSRINHLEEAQSAISASLQLANQDLRSRIEHLSESAVTLSREAHGWFSINTLGLEPSQVKTTRFIPLRVYISEDEAEVVARVATALDEVIKEFGFELSDEFPEIRGSWYKKWFARTTEFASQPEVSERLGKLERALELKGLGVPQADIDDKQASAIAKLMKSLDKIPNAAIQSGSILLIKVTQPNGPIVQVRTLTQTELLHLENNQKLLSSPSDLLEKLSLLCSGKSIDADPDGKAETMLTQRHVGKRNAEHERKRTEHGQQRKDALRDDLQGL